MNLLTKNKNVISNIRKILSFIILGSLVTQCLLACTSEQIKRGTYSSIHEKQRQDCIQSGRTDCDQYDYDSYDEYQRKKNSKGSE